MKGSKKQNEQKKINNELKTFTVPLPKKEIRENKAVSTNLNSTPTKKEIIDKAFKFHSQGNISEAVKYYQYFLKLGFSDPRVFSNYGVILKQAGQTEKAIELYKKSIDLFPNISDAYSNLGNLLKDLGRLKDAEVYLRKAIKIKPDFADAYNNLGSILKDTGNLKDAEKNTLMAIKLKPNFVEAHLNIGGIFYNLGKFHEAEIYTRKAIELNPALAEAHCNLGNILGDLGKSNEAEISTRRAIELVPNYAEAHYNLGNILKNLGKNEEARNHWIKAVTLKPELDKPVRSLAMYLCFSNEYELALKYLKKNKSDSCQSLYLGCLLSLDKENEFIKKYNELIDKKVCNAEVGGIVEHANIIYEKNLKSPFCNEAKNFVHWDKIDEELFSNHHLKELIDYFKESDVGKRSQGLLSQGMQTSGNLFTLNFPFINKLRVALENKIDFYKKKI